MIFGNFARDRRRLGKAALFVAFPGMSTMSYMFDENFRKDTNDCAKEAWDGLPPHVQKAAKAAAVSGGVAAAVSVLTAAGIAGPIAAAIASALAAMAHSWDHQDDRVDVDGYTREDGTHVQGHQRTWPDGVEFNNFSA